MICTLEDTRGGGWINNVTPERKAELEEANRELAIAELTRLGRPPAPDDTRTRDELWDDVKERPSGDALRVPR